MDISNEEQSTKPQSSSQAIGSNTTSTISEKDINLNDDKKNLKEATTDNHQDQKETSFQEDTKTQEPTKRKRKKRYTKNSYGRPHKANRFKSPNLSDEDNHCPKKKNIRNDNPENRNLPPHEGSFASPAMQSLYNVTLNDDNNDTSINKEDDKIIPNENEIDKNDEIDECSVSSMKRPKKKVALFIGFLGTNYAGMQINQNCKSIQAYIELALYRAGYISSSNFGHPSKYAWSNSARTDKGVHSCAQVCSTKITVPADFNDAPVSKTANSGTLNDWEIARQNINKHLPPDIQILDIIRTTRKFCAKSQRNKVRYQYMVPSFVLQNHQIIRSAFESIGIAGPLEKNRDTYLNPFSTKQWEALRSSSILKYRATPQDLERLQTVLKAYVGTHFFHNYTNGKTSADPSSQRYILDFDIMKRQSNDDDDDDDSSNYSKLGTLVDPVSGIEWIPLWITGQSFLLHQIRKMMTVVIDVTRQMINDEVLQNSMNRKTQMILSIAPAQGLFLDMSYFDSYNRKKEVKSNNFDHLDWHSEDGSNPLAVQRWNEFKNSVILVHIMKEEWKEGNFLKYIYWQEFAVDRSRYFPDDSTYGSND